MKKFRQKYNIFVAEGEKICLEIIESKKIDIESIFATKSWLEKHTTLLQSYTAKIEEITENELKKISSLSTPNQVLITAKNLDFDLNKDLVFSDLCLYLDGIQDPGNMGTILRNADWFGIPYVFCSDTCVDIYNPKVIQASMGAFLRVKSKEMDLQDLLLLEKNVAVYGTLLDGENLFEKNLDKKGIIVIGSEGKGISEKNMPLITHKIKIPAYGNGAESLNAAVASGIVCAWFKL